METAPRSRACPGGVGRKQSSLLMNLEKLTERVECKEVTAETSGTSQTTGWTPSPPKTSFLRLPMLTRAPLKSKPPLHGRAEPRAGGFWPRGTSTRPCMLCVSLGPSEQPSPDTSAVGAQPRWLQADCRAGPSSLPAPQRRKQLPGSCSNGIHRDRSETTRATLPASLSLAASFVLLSCPVLAGV